MKVCGSCDTAFETDDWQCPHCSFRPEIIDGRLAFAPDLALESEGFEANYFQRLADQEAGNFWFRSRNRLVIWALKHYFPEARNFLEIGCGTGFVLQGISAALPTLVLSGSEIFCE